MWSAHEAPCKSSAHKTVHRSPTPNPKPLKQNNAHKTPCKFNAHKVANPVLTKNTHKL